VSIGVIVNLWSIAFHKPREYLRVLKYVDVIVRQCHTEEIARSKYIVMQQPQESSSMSFILLLQSKMIVLSHRVHASFGSKHHMKPS
jgi:hypothetical protein